MRNEEENKNLKLLAQFFLIVFVTLLCLVFVYYGVSSRKASNVTFKEKGAPDYQVYLKENDYYQEPYLEKGMSYVASLIDYVKIDFDYNLNSSKPSDIDYKYRIDAELIITERGNENAVLYRENIKLKDEVSNTAKTNSLIDESINIKYDDYNAKVNSFKQNYALSVSSKLVVTMHIDAKATSNEISQSEYTSAHDLTVSIPLSEQTIEIKFDSTDINETKEILEYSNFNPINYIYLAVGIILGIVALILVVKLIRYFYRKRQGDSEYAKLRNKILREYDRLIVETKAIKDQKNYRSEIIVNSFDELLDARDNLELPILFYEDYNQKSSTFMVIDGSHVYKYKIFDKK